MAKMRVHELAKELGLENKQIIEFLNTTEYAVTSHSSNIEEAAQQMVRKKFSKAEKETAPAEEKKAAPEQKTPAKDDAAKTEKIQYNSCL